MYTSLYKSTYESPLGFITMVSDGQNLVGLWLEGQTHFEESIKVPFAENNDIPVFHKTSSWLDKYFAGEAMGIVNLPLSFDCNPISNYATPFRKVIWQILCDIPYGKLVTYGDIAKEIAALTGKEKISAQAVGNAVGHNPISIIVPCHRVVGAGGKLTGYAGGLDLKIKLLELEGFQIDKENKRVII